MNKFFKNVVLVSFFFLILPIKNYAVYDLNELSQPFVLDKFQIKIPEYPFAFNPSIVRWNGQLLMSFRFNSNFNNHWHSQIGIVWLDENFKPIGTPQLLDTRMNNPLYPSKSEDARLFTVGDCLYIIYNDNNDFYDDMPRRMYYSELFFDGQIFHFYPECINTYEGASQWKWEKNWVPFDYNDNMLLAYSIVPHRIFLPLFRMDACETVCSTTSIFPWDWGANRLFGGTPAVKVGDQYLSFFHSSMTMSSLQSNGWQAWHYFMGAYTFQADPPFAITKVSPMPIVGKDLYENPLIYKRVVFPAGIVIDDKYIWISYGREDCESWILKLDKQGLLDCLVPVSEIVK